MDSDQTGRSLTSYHIIKNSTFYIGYKYQYLNSWKNKWNDQIQISVWSLWVTPLSDIIAIITSIKGFDNILVCRHSTDEPLVLAFFTFSYWIALFSINKNGTKDHSNKNPYHWNYNQRIPQSSKNNIHDNRTVLSITGDWECGSVKDIHHWCGAPFILNRIYLTKIAKLHLPINQIMCFWTHFFRNLRPRYITIENIIKYCLKQGKEKSKKPSIEQGKEKSKKPSWSGRQPPSMQQHYLHGSTSTHFKFAFVVSF